MMFGASAVIILALNPRILKEIDIAQLFSRPVVLIQDVENVTQILSAIARSELLPSGHPILFKCCLNVTREHCLNIASQGNIN